MIQAGFRSQEVNPAKLVQLYRRELELCRAKKGETIAVVSDLATRREYIQAAFAAADDLGADIYELCVNALPSWTKVGVPTIGQCKGTLEAVRAADLVVVFHVPLFTQWLKQVMDGGTRVLMKPTLTLSAAPADTAHNSETTIQRFLIEPPSISSLSPATRGAA